MKKYKYPEGTVYSGNLAFVPVPESEGGGFKTVDLNTGKEYDSFSDNLFPEEAFEQKKENTEVSKSEGKSIEFDVDYKHLVMDNTAGMKEYAENLVYEMSTDEKKNEKPKVQKPKDVKNASKLRKNNNVHKEHRKRMRKRFEEYGLENFAEHEVLEMLLYYTYAQRNTNDIAHDLIAEFGSIQNVFKSDVDTLMTVDGIGEQSAVLINLVKQTMIYLNKHYKETVCLSDSTLAGQFCCSYLNFHTEENFIAIMLDTNRNVKKVVEISRGTENETAYYPRKVAEAAIKYKANTVLVAHNHTGNSVHPSDSDIELTKVICNVLEGMRIKLVDHIICCENIFTSLADRGAF